MIAKADGTYEVKKHYNLGRMAFELPLVMPDQKTVYLTDDGDNVMFGMFKADRPADLTCGTLYGAKVTQTSDVLGGTFDIDWISLGHACDDDLVVRIARTCNKLLFRAALLSFCLLFRCLSVCIVSLSECVYQSNTIDSAARVQCSYLLLGCSS